MQSFLALSTDSGQTLPILSGLVSAMGRENCEDLDCTYSVTSIENTLLKLFDFEDQEVKTCLNGWGCLFIEGVCAVSSGSLALQYCAAFGAVLCQDIEAEAMVCLD